MVFHRRRLLGVGRPLAAPSSLFATFDPANTSSFITLSGGNLIATVNAANPDSTQTRTITSHAAGKYYWEITITVQNGNQQGGGVIDSTFTLGSTFIGSNTHGIACYQTSATLYNNVDQGALGTWFNDRFDFAVDINGAKRWWARKNGGSWLNAGDPVGGTGGFDLSASGMNGLALFVAVDFQASAVAGSNFVANFGASAYAGTPPAGYGNW